MSQTYLLYMAIPRDRWRLIPPTLMPTMVRKHCADCGQDVLAHRAMLRASKAACRRQRQGLRVVCEPCAERTMREDDQIPYYVPDTRELDKYFRQG